MKRFLVFFLLILFIPVLALSQTQIKAENIMDQINERQPVNYENVEIVGDIDFTSLKDITPDEKSDNIYLCNVRSPVSFVNCVFSGNVIGYLTNSNVFLEFFNINNDEEGWID